MDPDLASVAAALAASLLAVLGSRRRAWRRTGAPPTAGQRLAAVGTDLSMVSAKTAAGMERLAASLLAATVQTGGVATGAAIRGVSSISTQVSGEIWALGGATASRAGGLVLDGVLAFGDLASSRGRAPARRRPSPAADRSAAQR